MATLTGAAIWARQLQSQRLVGMQPEGGGEATITPRLMGLATAQDQTVGQLAC